MNSETPTRTMHVGDYQSGLGDVDYEIELGDCMPALQHMPDRSVDLLLTDIPYGEVNRPTAGIREFDKGIADHVTFDLEAFLKQAVRVTRGSMYVFCGDEQISTVKRALRQSPLVSVRACVWLKTNPAPTNGQWGYLSAMENCAFGRRSGAEFHEHCEPNMWVYPTLHHSHRLHRTEKPQDLLRRLISASSSPEQLVFDPCMGSASTGEAALRLGRRFMGIELDSDTYAVAKKRLRDVTGNAPIPFDGWQESLYDEDMNWNPRALVDDHLEGSADEIMAGKERQ